MEQWERPEQRHKLLELTVKVLEPHTIPSQRASSLLLTSGTGVTHTISCGESQRQLELQSYGIPSVPLSYIIETKESIIDWTTAIHHATAAAVNATRVSGLATEPASH